MTKDADIVESFIELAKELRENQKLTIELLERKEKYPTLQVAGQITNALGYSLSELIHPKSRTY